MPNEEIVGIIDEIFTNDEDIINQSVETNIIEEPVYDANVMRGWKELEEGNSTWATGRKWRKAGGYGNSIITFNNQEDNLPAGATHFARIVSKSNDANIAQDGVNLVVGTTYILGGFVRGKGQVRICCTQNNYYRCVDTWVEHDDWRFYYGTFTATTQYQNMYWCSYQADSNTVDFCAPILFATDGDVVPIPAPPESDLPSEDTDSGEGSASATEIIGVLDAVEPDEEDIINDLTNEDLTEAEITVEDEEVEPIISNQETLATIGNVSAGDRVMIALVNGEATVVGVVGKGDAQQSQINSIEADVATIDTLVAGKASIADLNAAEARIGTLEADNVTINDTITAHTASISSLNTNKANVSDLTAATARITSLETDKANISDLNAATARIGAIEADYLVASDMTAEEARVNNLLANKVDTSTLTANYITSSQIAAAYAKLDASNITTATIRDAWIDKVMVQSGLLAQSGTVYELDAIQLNADRITAGTIDVQRLVVTVDGEKYMVHFNNGTPVYEKLDGDIIEDLTITADKIVAGAITAEKITTQNIVGTGGWINLRSGTFNYVNAQSGEGISWDGSHLNILANTINIGSTNVMTAINSATSTANTAASNASSALSTANAAASDATTALNTANSASSTASTANTNASTALSTATAASATASTANTNASTALSTANSASTTATEAKNAVNDLEVGGRNIARKTYDLSGNVSAAVDGTALYARFTTTATGYSGELDGDFKKTKVYHATINPQSATNYVDFISKNSAYELEPDTYYTLSFYAKGNGNFHSYLYGGTLNSQVITSWGYSSTAVDGDSGSIPLTSEWKHYWIVRKTRSDIDPTVLRSLLVARLMKPTDEEQELYISNIKFEKGNKATDWTPAPEDVDESVSDAATTAANAQTAAESAQSTADDAQSAVNSLEIGGRNLLQNQYLYADFANQSTKESTVSCWAGLSYNAQKLRDTLVGGETYMFTYDVELVAKTSVPTLYSTQTGFLFYSSSTASANRAAYVTGITEIGDKAHFSQTITMPSEIPSDFVLYCYTQRYTTQGGTPYGFNTMKFTNIKLEKGNKATDYTPAPEDAEVAISAAQSTADSAATDASTALSTANSASSTANTAASNASTALSTANTASSNASSALSTANTAASNASTALSTANTASSNASTALSTANTANTNASTALTNAADLDKQVNGVGLYWSVEPHFTTTSNNYPVIVNNKQIRNSSGVAQYLNKSYYSSFEAGMPTTISFDIESTNYPIMSGEVDAETGTVDYVQVLSSSIVDTLEQKADGAQIGELAESIENNAAQIGELEDSVETVAGNLADTNSDVAQLNSNVSAINETIVNIRGKVNVSSNVTIGDGDGYNIMLDSTNEPSIQFRFGATPYARMTKEELNITTANITYLRLGNFLLERMSSGQLILKER